MVYFLFHIEPANLPIDRAFTAELFGSLMFPAQQVIINQTGEIQPSTENQFVFKTFDEARAHPDLANLKWVFFHNRAKKYLQEYGHPEDNVIYCVGSDWMGLGYGPGDLEGDWLRVAAPDPDTDDGIQEYHAATLLPLIAYDRAMKLWQKRHLTKR